MLEFLMSFMGDVMMKHMRYKTIQNPLMLTKTGESIHSMNKNILNPFFLQLENCTLRFY